MTGNEAKKKLAMMRSGAFSQLLYSAITLLHEEVMGEAPMTVEEYEKMTQQVIQTLSSRLQPVVKKKEKWVQVDLESSIKEIKRERYERDTEREY